MKLKIQKYGIAKYDKKGRVIKLIEKPKRIYLYDICAGIYFYDKNVCEYARQLKPSKRGEFEIIDLNNIYLEMNQLYLERNGPGT